MPELDVVALAEEDRRVRLVTCKRSPDKLVRDLSTFDGHVARFLAAFPRFAGWNVEKVAIAPLLDAPARVAIKERGYVAEDLADLTNDLSPAHGARPPAPLGA